MWRLFTNFFFFGAISLDFFFHMFFLVRYCRMLEEGSFRGRPADFLLMLLFGGALLTLTLTQTLARTRTLTLTLALTLTPTLTLTLTRSRTRSRARTPHRARILD